MSCDTRIKKQQASTDPYALIYPQLKHDLRKKYKLGADFNVCSCFEPHEEPHPVKPFLFYNSEGPQGVSMQVIARQLFVLVRRAAAADKTSATFTMDKDSDGIGTTKLNVIAAVMDVFQKKMQLEVAFCKSPDTGHSVFCRAKDDLAHQSSVSIEISWKPTNAYLYPNKKAPQ